VKASIAFHALALSVLVTAAAGAQVGYPPNRSPFVDIERTQEITLLGGYFSAARDPAGTAPRSGALTGVHYEWRASGPAHLTAEFAHIGSSHELIDPAKIGAARDLGVVNRSLYSFDAGLAMSLTGARTRHQIAPLLKLGAGFVSDLKGTPDSSGFKFGTRFAFTWGGGVRWIPSATGRFAVRVDVTNRLYTIGYPESFYVPPTGGTAVLSDGQARSFWTNNPAFTLGISRLF
jgi:hypothetical protein